MCSLLHISLALAVLFGVTADAVCTPQLTYSNTKLTGVSYTQVLLYIPGTTIGVGVSYRLIYDFDTSATTATITANVRAGSAASGTWAGDQANGANARFGGQGGIMKPDGTMVYFAIGSALAHVTLSGNYPVAQFAGDQAASAACTEGDGTAARLNAVHCGPAIADGTGDTLLVVVNGCHRLALVQTNSPHTVTWQVGDGNPSQPTTAGYGTVAAINTPTAVTSFRNRFYASDNVGNSVLLVNPAANWQLVVITTGTSPAATTNDIPFDNTYRSAKVFNFQGGFFTWSNCWLQLFQRDTGFGHIVDPEGGNMFLLAGIASSVSLPGDPPGSPQAYFASADLAGNVWVSGHAGVAADVGKHSIAYTGCPALSPHKCKWQTATATLPQVPPRTRTVTLPVATPAPMTTAPATTAAVSSSASTSSGSPATIAAATSAAATSAVVGTTAAATSAVVGTTAAATSAAATTAAATTSAAVTTAASTTAAAASPTAATSTTAAGGPTTASGTISSSASFFGTGNGASSVTAAALGLVTMVLAMF